MSNNTVFDQILGYDPSNNDADLSPNGSENLSPVASNIHDLLGPLSAAFLIGCLLSMIGCALHHLYKECSNKPLYPYLTQTKPPVNENIYEKLPKNQQEEPIYATISGEDITVPPDLESGYNQLIEAASLLGQGA